MTFLPCLCVYAIVLCIYRCSNSKCFSISELFYIISRKLSLCGLFWTTLYSYATHSDISQKGLSTKYVTLFWTNFDSPLSVTHLATSYKVCHTSRTPKFLVVHAYIHV